MQQVKQIISTRMESERDYIKRINETLAKLNGSRVLRITPEFCYIAYDYMGEGFSGLKPEGMTPEGMAEFNRAIVNNIRKTCDEEPRQISEGERGMSFLFKKLTLDNLSKLQELTEAELTKRR